MKKEEKQRIEMADFETTVFKGQQYTEVWAAATVTLGTEDVYVFHSIDELFDYYCEQNESMVIYFHNLKFDGHFILYYLREVLHFKQAEDYLHNDVQHDDFAFVKKWKMPEKSYQYLISDKGQWYSIIVKVNRHYLEFRDSLKLLPFSVRQIGDAFKTKHRKLDMEYEGFRYAGCEITPEEEEYIKNDVLVVKEALEFMFSQGHTRSTIGSCCMAEFKATQIDYDNDFPNLYEIPIDECYGAKTAGDYILKSYRGGWCYLDKTRAGKIQTNGTTADVNSLYPSMMSSESGNRFPVSKPRFWKGNYIPKEAQDNNHYFFVRIATRFYLKPGKLPFIQIKRCSLYRGTDSLETSDYIDKEGNRHRLCCIWEYAKDDEGNFLQDSRGKRYKTQHIIDTRQTMTMTMTDYKLFLEHYDVEEFEILDGCYFYSEIGIFDRYIERYKKLKLESKRAMRTLAKLFLLNLYGKMAATTNSSFKVCYTRDDGSLGFVPVEQYEKTPGYIACGSAITSYARNFTIRAAQANYHPGERGFLYSDTDSIHCDLKPEEIKGITVHDKNFCCWKLESCWDTAIFVRQKTYIEHVTHENLQPVEKPYNTIKCAGMTDHCKMLFELSMQGTAEQNGYTENGTHKQWTDDEKQFLFNEDGSRIIRNYSDFKIGLAVPGKLMPKSIRGGIILYNDFFTMR